MKANGKRISRHHLGPDLLVESLLLALSPEATLESKQGDLLGDTEDRRTKSFDVAEVILRILNRLEAKFADLGPRSPRPAGEERSAERDGALEEAQLEILERLTLAAEHRDHNIGHHNRRVGQIAALIAQTLGVPQARVELLRRAAPLHDIGKLGIPNTILLKPGRLTSEEFDIMKTHTTIGATILSGSGFPLLQLAEEIALTHHERWDGTGYPQGLKGETIPLCGRIVAVADSFDAMTNRPYRKLLTEDEAWVILREGAGSQWDKELVEVFASVYAQYAHQANSRSTLAG